MTRAWTAYHVLKWSSQARAEMMANKNRDDALNVADGLGTRASLIDDDAGALRGAGYEDWASELEILAASMRNIERLLSKQLKAEPNAVDSKE